MNKLSIFYEKTLGVRLAALIILILAIIIFLIWIPAPKEPEPITLNGAEFKGLMEPYDRKSETVILYVSKRISDEEKSRYVTEWNELNSGFDRRDIPMYLGLDEPLEKMTQLKSRIVIDCRNGYQTRHQDYYYDDNENLIHMSERLNLKDYPNPLKHPSVKKIIPDSFFDQLAIKFCETSAY